MMSLRAVRDRLFALAASALAITFAACGDSAAAPKTTEPSGTYALTLIGDKTLPFYLGRTPDSSYTELDHGAMRVLSRGRLLVVATTYHYHPDSSFNRATEDSVIFSYRRTGDLVVLTFDDPLGARSDTLDMVTYFEQVGLRARSANYFRFGWPAPLKAGALYVK
jgi:hypothetical protein